MITPEEEDAIHKAMAEVKGDTPAAAALLGITRKQLTDIIRNNKALRERYMTPVGGVSPPNETVQLHRPPEIASTEEALQRDEAIAEAIAKEDQLVKDSLDHTGMSIGVRDLAMSLQRLQNRHFTRCVEMLGGGITKQFLEIMVEVDRITKRLNDPSVTLSEREQLTLREDRSRLLIVMEKFYDRANSAALIQAKVRMLKEQRNNNRQPNKPGFSPIIAIQGENVTVNESSK